MRLDRLLADHQPLGDFAVGQALGDQPQHLGLPWGQVAQQLGPGRRARAQPSEFADQPAGHGRGEQRVTGRDDPDRLEQPLGGDVLEQESTGTRPQRLVDVLVEIECGEHQHARAGPGVGLGGDPASRLDAIHGRHPDVHEDDIGMYLAAQANRFGTVRGAAHDVDVGLSAQQRAESGADDLLVVGDEHLDRWTGFGHDTDSLTGSVASTRNPPPSTGPAESVPPAIAARSRIPCSPCPLGLAAADPGPSSLIRSCSSSSLYTTATSTTAPGACWRAFVSASWTIRYADRSTPTGSGTGVPLRVSRTGVPAARAASISSSIWSRPGCGESSATSSTSTRSTPSNRRISVSASLAVPPMAASCCCPSAGMPGVASRAVSAWIAIIDR